MYTNGNEMKHILSNMFWLYSLNCTLLKKYATKVPLLILLNFVLIQGSQKKGHISKSLLVHPIWCILDQKKYMFFFFFNSKNSGSLCRFLAKMSFFYLNGKVFDQIKN